MKSVIRRCLLMLFVLCSICTGAQELPDGSVLISSRYRKGGRRFNVFTYENRKKAVGTWSEAVHSSAHNRRKYILSEGQHGLYHYIRPLYDRTDYRRKVCSGY